MFGMITIHSDIAENISIKIWICTTSGQDGTTPKSGNSSHKIQLKMDIIGTSTAIIIQLSILTRVGLNEKTQVTHTVYEINGVGYQRTRYTDHAMTKVEFTNLKITVYTIDGIRFHTNTAALVRGEYVTLNNTGDYLSNSIKSTGNLEDVEKFDTAKGKSNTRNNVNVAISAVGDLAFGAGKVIKVVSTGRQVASTAAKATDNAVTAYNVAGSANKLRQGELNSFEAWWKEALGYVPVVGTTVAIYVK